MFLSWSFLVFCYFLITKEVIMSKQNMHTVFMEILVFFSTSRIWRGWSVYSEPANIFLPPNQWCSGRIIIRNWSCGWVLSCKGNLLCQIKWNVQIRKWKNKKHSKYWKKSLIYLACTMILQFTPSFCLLLVAITRCI